MKASVIEMVISLCIQIQLSFDADYLILYLYRVATLKYKRNVEVYFGSLGNIGT